MVFGEELELARPLFSLSGNEYVCAFDARSGERGVLV
jgi:hypothetical protein